MPYQITLSDDLYNLVQLVFGNRLNTAKANASKYLDHIDSYQRLYDSILQAAYIEGAPSTLVEEISAPSKRKKKATLVAFNFCQEHPKYGAKRRPGTECVDCWLAYAKYNGKDAFERAKRSYQRKSGKTLNIFLDGKTTKSIRR